MENNDINIAVILMKLVLDMSDKEYNFHDGDEQKVSDI